MVPWPQPTGRLAPLLFAPGRSILIGLKSGGCCVPRDRHQTVPVGALAFGEWPLVRATHVHPKWVRPSWTHQLYLAQRIGGVFVM